MYSVGGAAIRRLRIETPVHGLYGRAAMSAAAGSDPPKPPRPPAGSSPLLPIETERLLLRAFEPGDIDALAALHGDPLLTRWVPWGPRSRAQAEAVLRRKMAKTTIEAEGDGLGIAPVVKGEESETGLGPVIGDFTLQCASLEHSTAEIGWMLLAEHQGRGLAAEACAAILRLAFEDLGFHRVFARIEVRNDASLRLAEKLGMRREAHFVENEWIRGEWQSEIVYAMLTREWSGRRDP
jgi:RimJ/RimL family protein N-acetyltransferase